MESLTSYKQILDKIRADKAVLFYLSFPSCGVCKSILPKVIQLIEDNFPELRGYYIDIEAVPEAGGQLSVFTVPAVLVYFQGKEMVREARNFGIQELGSKIDRYYSILFDQAGT
ncbi:MAG: thiol reductase thioredoxin [Spirochaetes bacterium GWB1_59_5]|nr:MAG: thiol reductase thioredoxin [Spirochaetes bacterium GWB1_59_5]